MSAEMFTVGRRIDYFYSMMDCGSAIRSLKGFFYLCCTVGAGLQVPCKRPVP